MVLPEGEEKFRVVSTFYSIMLTWLAYQFEGRTFTEEGKEQRVWQSHTRMLLRYPDTVHH